MTTSESSPPTAWSQMEFPLMSSAEGSLAKISPSLAQEPDWQAPVQAYGQSTPVWLANYDPDTSSWRTCQLSLDGALDVFSETFPRSGILANGTAYRLPPFVPLTAVIDSGLLPTPHGMGGGGSSRGGNRYGQIATLQGMARAGLLPTPAATRYGSSNNGCPGDGRTEYRTKGKPSLETMARHNLFPTPTSTLGSNGGLVTPSKAREGGTLIEAVSARMFPTPTAGDAKASGSRNTPSSKAHAGTSLTDFVRQDGGTGRWRTPTAADNRGSSGKMKPGKQMQLVDQVRMWPTPKASAAGPDLAKPGRSSTGISLQTAVATWPTPASRDHRSPNAKPFSERGGGTRGEQLPNAVGGQLNPEFVEWLMGFPKGWSEV